MTEPIANAAPEDQEPRFEEYFKEGAAPLEALMWWQLERNDALLAALRALCHGPAALVRLRLWVFMELMGLPESHFTRDALNRQFHVLRDDALELVLKRLRDAGLLAWDASAQQYAVTALAQQLVGLLAPLVQHQQGEEDADLAGLLAQVAGAHQLGTLDPAQLNHLKAQLWRLHEEFADAIASGSEFRLRRARQRFERALALVDKASEALTAIIREAQGDARLERLARELGLAQARLLAMASQFNRALQQADRQRVTLGSTGVTTTDVRRWLQAQDFLENLVATVPGTLLRPVHPVMVSQHELLDTTEAEFERDRPTARVAEPLPDGLQAPAGELAVMSLPAELGALQQLLEGWTAEARRDADVAPAVLGDSYAQASYRAQLLPLLGDAQARHLSGATGDLARQPWRVQWSAEQGEVADAHVRWMSRGALIHEEKESSESPP
ncbi:MAG: hypothetical protein JO224_03495 [Pelomonas sp.]|nr:hypothetical protein [Roseateles sp.]